MKEIGTVMYYFVDFNRGGSLEHAVTYATLWKPGWKSVTGRITKYRTNTN